MDILLQDFSKWSSLSCKSFVVANGISTKLFMNFMFSAHLLFTLEAKASKD